MLRNFLDGHARTKTVFNGVPSVDSAALYALRKAKRAELGLSDRDVLVLGIGRLVEQKRPFLFLRIAKELHTRAPATKFLWVGDGKLSQQWHEAIVHEQMEGTVSCAGWQSDVLPYLLAGDVLLHVAEFEGLPFVVIEAMAAGLACAVTRDLASEIPFLDEGNVLFADNVEELAEKMCNPRAMARIAEAGRRLFEDKLSVEKMAESYERLYVDAIGRNLT